MSNSRTGTDASAPGGFSASGRTAPGGEDRRTGPPAASKRPRTGRAAVLVALGILCTRLTGLVRQRVFAYYFGQNADAADAFSSAIRIPNFLQNIFGEGGLSASFIPVYAALIARGDEREASRVAGAVFAILALTTSVLVAIGVITTPLLIAAIAPGFTGAKRDLTIALVRILFPGTGLLVLSAWCLGILNSHHKFLLSYTAPMVWNVAMIVTLIAFGTRVPRSATPDAAWAIQSPLAVVLAWGSVVGSALQFVVQLPAVVRLAPHLRLALETSSDNVRAVLRAFGPTVMSRGVVQFSAYIDSMIATLLPTGAPTALLNATTIYTLPVSLFGMSVSAAELPAMSGEAGTAAHSVLRDRVNRGLRQIAFFVVPSALAFVAFGDVIAAALFQTGRFTHADAVYVWGILAGSAVGLLAQTLGRLYSSTYYAFRDTRTPLRYAVIRVILTTVLGLIAALVVPGAIGVGREWGAAGLTASAGVSGWVEFAMLRATLNRRIGDTGLPRPYIARLWLSALAGALIGWALKLTIGPLHPIIVAAAVLVPYGAVYIGLTIATGIPEARSALGRFTSRSRASSAR